VIICNVECAMCSCCEGKMRLISAVEWCEKSQKRKRRERAETTFCKQQ